MKKITLLTLLFIGALGFSQQTETQLSDVDPSTYTQNQVAIPNNVVQKGTLIDLASLGLARNATLAPKKIVKRGTLMDVASLGLARNAVFYSKKPTSFIASENNTFVTTLLEHTPDLEAEVLADENYRTTQARSLSTGPTNSSSSNLMSDIIPTAGATETFVVAVGDNFFDPGGPGGSSTGGTAGNYPNCDCITTTTLDGASEIEFLFFSVFATFDWLKIYDSADTTGPVLFDNSTGGANQGDITLADMIASNGSASFVGTSGSLTFEFFATAVVDYGGWDAEIIATAGGGGGSACNEEIPSNGFENGIFSGTGPLAPNQVVATDITVAADTDFSLDTVNVNLGIRGFGESITGSDIVIYGDIAGFPDSSNIIASFPAVVPTSQVVLGTAFNDYEVLDVTFDIPATMLAGQAGAITTYWISIYSTASNADDVFWEATTATLIGYEGVFSVDNAATWAGYLGGGTDMVYNFSGECMPIGGGGGGGCTAGIYTDRASFDAEAGTLVDEDLAGGPGGIIGCGLVISAAGDSCYAPGEIQVGIEITSNNSAGGQTVFVEAGNFGLTDDAVGSNTFVDYTIINFPGNDVNSFAFEAWALLGGPAMDIRIFGTGGLIATESVSDTGTGVFFGYIASETIVSVEIEDLSGAAAELVTNISFGECVSGPPATNDECAGAFPIACGDVYVGSTVPDTDSGGNPAPDEFFTFTGSGSPELVTLSLCDGGTDYDSLLRVFSDCTLANEIATNDDACGLQSELTFLSDGTSTYIIMVEGFGSNAGNFSLAVTCEMALVNDECEGALPMACGDIVSGSTIDATFDAGAPVCTTAITAPGVWYVYEDTTGLVTDITLTMCNGTTDYDSKITVYTGDCGALVCETDNDDTCGLQSEVMFQSDGNTTFYILVHGFGAATGNFELEMICAPIPPPNDMIVNSIDVDEIGFPYTDPAVAMPAATTEAGGTPAGCDNAGVLGVWYNFVPEGDGTAVATVISPAGFTSVTFYTAPNETAVETDLTLVPWVFNQCVPGFEASINTVAGQAYYVYVANHGGITDIMIDGTNLGVSDNTIEGFSYYPNPADSTINLTSIDTIETVAIYNMLGQIVLDQNVDATTSQLNVSNLSTGAYIMKVSVNGQTGTYKVIKR